MYGPKWPYLLMCGSHNMRQVFRRLTVVNGTPGIWGVTSSITLLDFPYSLTKHKQMED